MGRSPLVPQRRVNKNGVLVTKHVRALPASAEGPTRALPAPAPATQAKGEDEHRADLIREITEALPRLESLYSDLLPNLRTDTLEAFRYAAARPEATLALTSMLQTEMGVVMTSTEPFLQLAARALPLASSMAADDSQLLPGRHVYASVRNGASEGGFREYDGPVTEDEITVFKAYVFAGAVHMDRSDYRAPHFYFRDVQKVADRMAELEEAAPAIAAALQPTYLPHVWEHVEETLTAVQESGADPRALADFMLDRRSTDIRSAVEALRGISAPLQDGAL